MLRNISKHNFTGINSKFCLTNGFAQVMYRPPMEINVVKLMGTIEHKVKRLRNGAIRLFLKTLNEDTSYCVHRVSIANSNLLAMVGNQLAVNKRIYIGGRMKTENVYIENQIHQDVEVMANELFFLEPNPKVTVESMEKLDETRPIQPDQNSIEMLAFIGTEVYNERNICAFSLNTHFTTRKGMQDESISRDLHRVLIYNDPEMLEIGRNLRKHDRVYVNGLINYITKKYPDGKDYTNGHIQPTNLVRLKKFE
ncbi:uncharacterized protein LOC129568976 isoform X2 [Sitodiplosis mosellana]|uniref:uncharacterized protein LOC129568976 isoform X2 n=1 Tax=Sitodiplosis mosellana TaxID=263140 RepID=UPI002443BD5C|nr:uncharacterized protein LOC129568976 isoform X2 [Sitodiplosis mosellana]